MDEASALLKKMYNSRERITTRIFVLLYSLIYGFAFQISRRAQPQYVYYYLKQHSGGNITNNKTENVSKHICSAVSNDDKFQEETASWTWYLKLSEYGVSIPVIMLTGPMTDRIRRKPIIIWNGLLVFLSFASMTVVVFFDLNVYYFVIAVMVNGFSGTYYTFNFNALMSDVTSENKQR
jgi:MFS family permease